ncbi:MAG TPA: endospore germination permease [Pseudobacteroides sp.]|uniref:GerAB/ArcD/ProY family transporter n=1 Tax=Pseudobacteroides sp. TaxID=1968840 RepID=UPI002F91CC93
MREGKIGVQEAIALIAITISVKVYFTSPTYVSKIIGTASWYMTLISTATAILGFTFIYKLLKRFPGKDLIDAFELTLGHIVGFIASMVLLLYFLVNTSLLLREFAEVLKIYALPLTPPSFVIGMFLMMVCISCFLGLESIARTARLIGLYVLAGFLIVIILAFNNYDYHNLFPFLGNGLGKTLLAGASRSSFYGEVISLGIIATSMQGVSHIKKAGYTALTISGLIVSIALFATMMAFNYATSQEIVSRMYELSRVIRIGGFLQRLDPIFLFTWCIGTLIAISLLFYCLVKTYCKSFKIKDMRPAIIPLAVIVFTVCMLPEDMITISEYVQFIRQNDWSISLGLPTVVLIIAVIRKKKGVSKSV